MSLRRSSLTPAALIDAAFASGTLVTIATGTVLLTQGWNEGELGRYFRLAGRALLEQIGVPSASAPLTSVALGYVHHLTIASIWGFLLALVVLPWRGAMCVLMAALAAGFYVLLITTIMPAPLRIGYTVTGTVGSAVPIAAAMFVALLAGAWLASGEGEQ